MKQYIVVENAGYERECDVFKSTSFHAARAWMREHYEQDEIEDLHVDIATEIDGEREYVY
jgi:hypothetical protein